MTHGPRGPRSSRSVFPSGSGKKPLKKLCSLRQSESETLRLKPALGTGLTRVGRSFGIAQHSLRPAEIL
eukprot:9175966-Alexandrium_andersonii.AAC.1